MTEMNWHDRLKTGHPRLDAQHRGLLELLEAITAAHNRGDTAERLRRLLDELRLYAEFHFVSEENLMADAGYPGITEHQEDHQRLMSRLRTRINEYLFEVIELPVLLDFLYDWLATHTAEYDGELVRFLDASG